MSDPRFDERRSLGMGIKVAPGGLTTYQNWESCQLSPKYLLYSSTSIWWGGISFVSLCPSLSSLSSLCSSLSSLSSSRRVEIGILGSTPLSLSRSARASACASSESASSSSSSPSLVGLLPGNKSDTCLLTEPVILVLSLRLEDTEDAAEEDAEAAFVLRVLVVDAEEERDFRFSNNTFSLLLRSMKSSSRLRVQESSPGGEFETVGCGAICTLIVSNETVENREMVVLLPQQMKRWRRECVREREQKIP